MHAEHVMKEHCNVSCNEETHTESTRWCVWREGESKRDGVVSVSQLNKTGQVSCVLCVLFVRIVLCVYYSCMLCICIVPVHCVGVAHVLCMHFHAHV